MQLENQRIRLSKRMLKDALIELLMEHPLDKITVYQICQRAQINRTTFYKYYGNPQDLLNDIEKDIFAELETLLLSDGGLEQDGLTRVLRYFEKEHTKCRMLINAAGGRNFGEKLFRLPFIQSLLARYIPKEIPDTMTEYVHTFMYMGGAAIIHRWINKEHRESPEQIADLIHKLMLKIMAPIPHA